MNTSGKYNKIRGWLWLPAIGLIITPISFITKSIIPLFQNHYPFRVEIDYTIMFADLFLLIMVGIISWFFFKRKKHTPIIYIIYILLMVLMWEIVDGLHESQNDPPFIAMIFYCIVIVPYFTLSKRVHETFVIELNNEVLIERIFFPLTSFLKQFYFGLVKSKYFIFLFMIVFVFLGILINCALRSLRIAGDLVHTFDYL
ncbi:MAG: DUF2569 domain-containing protein [Bacteroidales bacterium]|nr:DUF2569 domain-containing protein [Bacteroidales bacterium]